MANVKVILRESIPSLGEAGEIVAVRPGHAHNFLIPQGKAALATEGNMRAIEHQKRVVAEKVAREIKALGVEKSRLESLRLEVKANVGEEGKLFGSVTVANIAELIAAQGIELDRRKIQLDEPIKEIGEHSVPVRLHKDVVANLKVRVSAAES
jgi:large subunit ribosomal protein L9